MEVKEQRQRETGFYHVNFNGRWTIGEYCEDDKWYILPYGEFMITEDFEEIDENRIERQPKKDELILNLTAGLAALSYLKTAVDEIRMQQNITIKGSDLIP